MPDRAIVHGGTSMKAASQEPVQVGRTRWRRFGLAAGAGVGATALVGWLAMTGALALQFAFSGIPFTLTADRLEGDGFVQYAFPDRLASGSFEPLLEGKAGAVADAGGPVNNVKQSPVDSQFYAADTVTQFRTATIGGLSQAICAPVPLGLGAIQVVLSGAGDTEADNLVIQAPALAANTASFNNIIIGSSVRDSLTRQGYQPGSDFTDPYGALGSSPQPIAGSFGQNADNAVLTGIRQVGVGTEAGSFRIQDLRLFAEFRNDCS